MWETLDTVGGYGGYEYEGPWRPVSNYEREKKTFADFIKSHVADLIYELYDLLLIEIDFHQSKKNIQIDSYHHRV